jgi:hypothetical protein
VLIYAVFIDAEKVTTFYPDPACRISKSAALIDAKEIPSYFFGIALTVSFRTAPRSLTS